MNKYITNSISGIWNSYGCPPEAGGGISISIEDSPGVDTTKTGSLIDLCGFKKNDSFEIGVLADSSTIRELVVMLPMVEVTSYQQNTTYYVPPSDQPTVQPVVDPCVECDEDPCGDTTYRATRHNKPDKKQASDLYHSAIENAYLFKIEESIINKILDVLNYKSYSIYQIKDILTKRANQLNGDNNIVKLMFYMVFYNFPPHLNWLIDTTIPPIAMYAVEYSTTLYKEDLSDIWQGNMPIPSKFPVEDNDKQIEHYLNEEEIFGGYDLNEFSDIKMKIFKCKWHSDGEYDSLIKGREATKDPSKWYGYNWPYDYCSVVENLQIQAGEVRDFSNNADLDPGVLIKQTSTAAQYYNDLTTGVTFSNAEITTVTQPVTSGKPFNIDKY